MYLIQIIDITQLKYLTFITRLFMTTNYLNTNYLYAQAGICPVIQSLVGGAVLVKNLVCIIRDLARCIFNGMGPESYNQQIDAQISKLDERIKIIKDFKHKLTKFDNGNLVKCFFNGQIQYDDFQKLFSQDLADSDKTKDEMIFKKLIAIEASIKKSFGEISLAEYQNNELKAYKNLNKRLCVQIEMQLWNIIVEQKIMQSNLKNKKITLPDDRIRNIFVALMTALPVVGTVYSIVSLNKQISKTRFMLTK